MKVEVIKENQRQKEIEFPVLMVSKSNNALVLFLTESTGVQLDQGDGILYPGVHYDKAWNMSTFVPFTGTVTLSND